MTRALGRHFDMRHLRRSESEASRARALAFGCEDVAGVVRAKLGDTARLVTAYPVPSPGLCLVVCVATLPTTVRGEILGDDPQVGDDQSAIRAPAHQGELALQSPTSPHETRGRCSSYARPCRKYRCIHHNWPQTERAGRPHHGRHNLPVIREVGQSCTLDVADSGWHTNAYVGAEIGVTKERVRQIVDRATSKMAIAQTVYTGMEDGLRARLYGKALVCCDYHRVADPNRIVVTGVIVPNSYNAEPTKASVVVRRKAGA